MSIRLKCPCNQVLSVADSAMGKKIRCPKCQTLISVPAIAKPVQPAPDPLANLSAVPSQPVYHPPLAGAVPNYPLAPGYALPQRKSNARGYLLASGIALLVTGVLAVVGVAIWFVMPLLSRPLQIEDGFTPVASSNTSTPSTNETATTSPSQSTNPSAGTNQATASNTPDSAPVNSTVTPIAPTGRNARETAMLAVAEKFVRHARQNEHKEAVAMIDVKLFHSRLYSPKGSYEAMTKDIPAGKLLGNFGTYALDGAPQGGRRHWQIIGTSQFDGQPGVVLRYYVEPRSPLDALTDPKLFNRLGAVITYDQISQKAGNLFTTDGQKTSLFDYHNLSSHSISRTFPSRAGYMMLVFDVQETEPKLVDLVNVLGQTPLSQTGAHVFLSDYHVFGGSGPRETYGTQASTMTIFGLSAVTLGGSWNPNDPGAKERLDQKIAAAAAAEEQKRPKRLEKLVQLWNLDDPKLQGELQRFRSDFPNDLGFELAVVCEKMRAAKPTFTSPRDQIVIKATQALYQQWRDPFFQYVEALGKSQNGLTAEADALFAKCVAGGFATTDYYVSRIESALDRNDKAAILAELEQWNRIFAVDGLTAQQDRLAKLSRRYEELEKSLNPPPSLNEMMTSGNRGPFAGRRGPVGMGNPATDGAADPQNNNGQGRAPSGSMASPGSSPSSDFPMGPPPGFGQPPAGFGNRQSPTRPQMPSGPEVIIKMTSSHAFDGGAITKKLMTSLKVNGHNFSQGGQSATLKLMFGGTLQEVEKAIDFGKVTARDEATKTIEVTIP